MSKGTLITAYFVLLFFLHQDFWWKNDPRLVFDILPVSLAYHVIWTLLVAAGWFLVAKYCWPEKLDQATEPGLGARAARPLPNAQAGGPPALPPDQAPSP